MSQLVYSDEAKNPPSPMLGKEIVSFVVNFTYYRLHSLKSVVFRLDIK